MPALRPHKRDATRQCGPIFSFSKGDKFALKDAGKSVLRIGSAHNKEGPAYINIGQISHLSNFFDTKLWFILIYEHNKPEQVDIHY